MNSLNMPPSGPTEQEVREHFKLSADAPLMRPAYTSIWALEDGTLLWDWRNGYADEKSKAVEPEAKLRIIMYVTGSQGSGKTSLIDCMSNAVEVNARSVLSQFSENLLKRVEENAHNETVVFTAQRFSPNTDKSLRLIAEERQLKFFNINLTQTHPWKQNS